MSTHFYELPIETAVHSLAKGHRDQRVRRTLVGINLTIIYAKLRVLSQTRRYSLKTLDKSEKHNALKTS